jgi:hypothetical protein
VVRYLRGRVPEFRPRDCSQSRGSRRSLQQVGYCTAPTDTLHDADNDNCITLRAVTAAIPQRFLSCFSASFSSEFILKSVKMFYKKNLEIHQ